MVQLPFCCSDINKYLPGPHFDPPSKDKVRALVQVISALLQLNLIQNPIRFMFKPLKKRPWLKLNLVSNWCAMMTIYRLWLQPMKRNLWELMFCRLRSWNPIISMLMQSKLAGTWGFLISRMFSCYIGYNLWPRIRNFVSSLVLD